MEVEGDARTRKSDSTVFPAVIRLNVGGTRFATSLRTLSADPTSMLAAMFSGRHTLSRDEDGCFFIDRDGTYFSYILNYLRDGDLTIPTDDSHLLDSLHREVSFYQIAALEAKIEHLREHSQHNSLRISYKEVLTHLNSASKPVQLAHLDLSCLDLSTLNLAGANLQGSNLSHCNLSLCNLQGANLSHADLSNANLQNADLRDADLNSASLKMARLTGAVLKKAVLRNSEMESAKLSGADLRQADLQSANLKNACFLVANLDGANMLSASLEGANLDRANVNNIKGITLVSSRLLEG
eukprot:GILK01004236.1.p1 GENE.GILK01004236.1~~GILK01004236.1.p1  ORF type:complete len:297 (-),score=16.99 GILK01004236.1:301-1191(-)